MDEMNKNNSPDNTPEIDNTESNERVDAFFKKLEDNGVLEDSVNAQKQTGYNPDYIDLGDYEKSDTGFVSLRQKEGEVETFDSAKDTSPQSEKPEQASAQKEPDQKKNAVGRKKAAAKGGKKSGGKDKKSLVEQEYKKGHPGWRRFGKIVLFLFCIGVICACAVTVAAAMYLAKVTANDDELLDLNSLELSYATRLMAMNDETGEWEEYERIFGGENRVWVSYDEFPEELIKATIASEDIRFMSHKGVDIKRTIAAFINEYVFQIWGNTQGGSTITQQLIKNITNEKSVSGMDGALRKLREIYRAFMLERKYSKEQILEAYLNTFRLGGQVAGIEAAANYYFNKTTSELTLAESAAIVCITKYPSLYDPYINPDENKYQRENVVLWTMYENGMITEEEYHAALEESENLVFTKGDTADAESDIYSYFTDTAIREVIKDLQEINGMTAEEANNLFYGYTYTNEDGEVVSGGGGLTVYLTIDLDIQKTVEDVAFNPIYWDTETYGRINSYNNDVIWPALEYEDAVDENGETIYDENGDPMQVLAENQIQAAMVVMNYEGELLGVAGGIREKDKSLSLNRAVDSVRQTGSSMKPIAAYAPALELDKITYSTVFADAPVDVVNGQPWPRNYSWTYGPPVTVYDGLAQSLNTTAAATMKLIGPDYAFDFLTTSLGITSLVDGGAAAEGGLTDRTMSLALGGLTYGVSPYEMAAAYQVFGNGGTYYTPHCYTKVVDSRGATIINKEQNIQTIKALSDDTAYIMSKLLAGVTRIGTGTTMANGYSRGTDTHESYRIPNNIPIIGKTGTTSDNCDFWAIGQTPYYVMACWEGYDEMEYMYTYRPHPTQQAVNLVMKQIHEGLEYKNFPTCDDVIAANYCTATGELAGPNCPETATGYYKKDNVPPTCTHEYVPTEEELAAMYPTS